MKQIVLILLVLLSGCTAWEQVVEHSTEIEQIGQTAVDVGTTTSMFNPTIGVWIVAVGGLIIAVSKILKPSKNKNKNKENE